MNVRIYLLTICLFTLTFVTSCAGQSLSNSHTVESVEAGFEIWFPCKPESSKELFQKEPKIANAFSYNCEFEGIKFSVSLPERFEDFDHSKSADELDGLEELLRTLIGSNALITTRDGKRAGCNSREFEVEGGNTYGLQLNVAHTRGVYGVQAFGKYDKSSERAKIKETIGKFVNSFKLWEAC